MRVVGRGIQEFEKIRDGNLFYVDKTDFITAWYRQRDDITLITRPRRFGKTLTIDMLNCFFSTSYAGRADLFNGLLVSQDKEIMELQGTVPTIKLSFAGVKAETFRGFLISLAGRISILLSRYRFLPESGVLNEDEKEFFSEISRVIPKIPNPDKDSDSYLEFIFKLTHIFHLLSAWLFRYHGKKVYIFLDEYDTPLQTAYMYHYYDEAISVLRELFSETFKENEYLDRAVITGITRIAKESLFSDMNNLAVCSVLSGGYDSSFGFTQEEMKAILKEYSLTDKRDLVRFWYDGFTIGKETEIYNPWSVVNYLCDRKSPPQDYWAQSGGLDLVDHLVRRGGIALKEGFETLLGGGVIERRIRDDLIFPWLDGDESAVWSMLIAAGYIKPVPGAKSRTKLTITLTNHESLACLSNMVTKWFATRSGNYMEQFADALLADDLREMNAAMQEVVLTCSSSFDTGIKPSAGTVQPENFFHALTLGMLTCLSEDYRVTSNRESGFGRYDVSLEPLYVKGNLSAAILEFKVFDKAKGDRKLRDTADRARKQIDEKAYDADLLSRGIPTGKIRKYGFGFRGKEVIIVK